MGPRRSPVIDEEAQGMQQTYRPAKWATAPRCVHINPVNLGIWDNRGKTVII